MHTILGALLYSELGHLIIETVCTTKIKFPRNLFIIKLQSIAFYTTLTELEWYTFKKNNRRVYYMLVCYSQRYSAVTVMTNTTTDRALLMQVRFSKPFDKLRLTSVFCFSFCALFIPQLLF